jgi:hypothetical protein
MNVINIFEFIASLYKLLEDKISQLGIIQNLSYKSCMQYIIENKNRSMAFCKAAIFKEEYIDKIIIYIVFLDKNENVVCDSRGKPYGRKMIAKTIDNELHESFKDNSLILVE